MLLRDENLPNRSRSVGPRLQVPRQYSQPSIHPERLDVRHRLAVNTSSAAVARTTCQATARRLRATPCRSESKTAGSELPSLSHVAPSGVAELSLRLGHQSPCPFLRQSRTKAPSLRRHYPTSPVLRTLPARLGPRGLSVGACHATSQGFPCWSIPLFPCCRQYPGGTRRCLRTGRAFPVIRAGRLPCVIPFRGLLGVHSRYGWSLSRPGRPVPPECFRRYRYLHHPLRLLPAGATAAGRDSHPLKNGTFPRHTRQGVLGDPA